MKVAIHTITNGTNYGNKLQNYALQRVLEKKNIQVDTLLNKCSSTDFKLSLNDMLKRKIDEYKTKRKNRKHKTAIEGREKSFEVFKKKYIRFANITINNNYNDSTINDKYDYFICGSDQIWNPNFLSNANANFLSFVNKDKRIAYAPSIASSKIPIKRVEEYTRYFNMISKISVREKQGAKLIKELTKKDVPVLIDPTMLITKEEWSLLEEKPDLDYDLEKPYMVTCFLGKISEKRKAFFNDISNKFQLQVIHLTQLDFEKEYMLNPSHFLYLISNAKIVLTDSFHACVFSILYHTPFYVLQRAGIGLSMNSRIDNLLELFKLENRMTLENIDNITLECNYEYCDKILYEERKKGIAFLDEALKLKDNM